jgi:hypothetical protein
VGFNSRSYYCWLSRVFGGWENLTNAENMYSACIEVVLRSHVQCERVISGRQPFVYMTSGPRFKLWIIPSSREPLCRSSPSIGFGLQGSMRVLMEGLLSAACEQESVDKPHSFTVVYTVLRLLLTSRYRIRHTRSPPHG